ENANDSGGLQFEQGNSANIPNPVLITWSTDLNDGADVTIQSSDFGYVLGGPQVVGNNWRYLRFYDTLNNATDAAAGNPDHIQDNNRWISETHAFGENKNFHVYDTVGDKVSIQAAHNDAIAGDTINVNNGTYGEDVLLNKGVSLVSVNGASSTTIQGVSTGFTGAVRISASGVVLVDAGQGFTIEGAGQAGIYLVSSASNVFVEGSI